MIRRVSGSRSRTLIAIAIVAAACSNELSSPSTADVDPRWAKAAGGTSPVKVASAAPDSGLQNTTIDVVVNGSGFEAGMIATWKLAGVADPLQVRTNSTQYVSSRKLVANITISAEASAADWDIEVMGKGKGGIGTELFEVKISTNVNTTPQAQVVFDEQVNVSASGQPESWEPALITGDYRDRFGAAFQGAHSGEYQGQFCGYVTIFKWPGAELSAEADRFYDPATMDGPCGGSRYYNLYLSGRAAAPLKFGPQHFVYDLDTFAPGETRLQGVVFGILQTNCNGLHFNDKYSPASSVRVTRLSDVGGARRWRVESQGSHRAMCTTYNKKGPVPTGVHHYLPFAFTFTEVSYPSPRFP